MALFKILRGGANKLKEQNIHDGWAYFVPSEGQLYIDVTNGVILEFNEGALPADSTPADRFKAQAAAALADMIASYTRDAIIITCKGTIPTINISITIILMGWNNYR